MPIKILITKPINIIERATIRFWSKIDIKGEDDCWEWKGYTHSSGYGYFYPMRSEGCYTHRYSYVLHKGAIPFELLVLHHCDNRRCVNPNHLYLGTHGDNQYDTAKRYNKSIGK